MAEHYQPSSEHPKVHKARLRRLQAGSFFTMMIVLLPTNSLAALNANADIRTIGGEQPNLRSTIIYDTTYSTKPTWLELSGTIGLNHLLRRLHHHSEVLRMKWTWSLMKTSPSNQSIQSWERTTQSSGRVIIFWKMELLPASRILLLSHDELCK